MRGVFLDLETYKPDDRHRAMLEPLLDEWVFYDGTDPADIIERSQGFEVLATNKVKMSRDVLSQLPDLKLIVEGATGVDNIDVEAARDLGITVCNVVGYSTESVAQQVFALMLSLAQSLVPYHHLVQSGEWQRTTGFSLLEYPMFELHGRTLGVVGYGDIAKAVERIAKAIGMDVLIAERKGVAEIREGRLPLNEVLAAADVLSIHCPLTEKTRGMIGADELSQMKDTAFVINCSRGGIIEETALADALKSGTLAGAGLDVLSQEPPRDGNPLLEKDVPNIIVTPHCAWASEAARLRMFEQIAAVIESFKAGQPMNVV